MLLDNSCSYYYYLFYDNRGDVEERIGAAAPGHQKEKIAEAVPMDMRVLLSLRGHKVAKADRGKGHETEVERLEEGPLLKRCVHQGGAQGHHCRRHAQTQHHPVHAGFPVVQIVVIVVVQRRVRNTHL